MMPQNEAVGYGSKLWRIILKFEETDEMVKNKEKEITPSELYSAIIDLLNIYADILDPDTYSEVMHYLEHGEYEMAYEGLFIDLIKANFQPQKIDMGYYLKICIKLKINNENIFNADFWEYLNNYLKKQQLY